MDDQTVPAAGDVITATVTKTLPFGVLVEHAGVPGLVRKASDEVGAELTLRVLEFDADERRFSASPA